MQRTPTETVHVVYRNTVTTTLLVVLIVCVGVVSAITVAGTPSWLEEFAIINEGYSFQYGLTELVFFGSLINVEQGACNNNGECQYYLGESHLSCPSDCPYLLNTQRPFILINYEDVERTRQHLDNNPFAQQIVNSFESNLLTADYSLNNNFFENLHPPSSISQMVLGFSFYYHLNNKSEEHRFSENLNALTEELINMPLYDEPYFTLDLIRPRYEALGYFYDFFRDDLSEEQRSTIHQHIITLIDAVEQGSASTSSMYFLSRPHRYVIGGKHVYSRIAALSALLSIYGDCEESLGCTQRLVQLVEGYKEHTTPFRDHVMSGGSHPAGLTYSYYSSITPYIYWNNAFVEEQDYVLRDYHRLAGLFSLYGIQFEPYQYSQHNYGEYPTFGDSYNRRQVLEFTHQLPAIYKYYPDPHIAQYLQTYSVERAHMYEHIYNFKRIAWLAFYYDLFADAPSQDLHTLPLAEEFGNAGFVMMRDTWDFDQSTTLVFKSSKFYTHGHTHLDQNSFTLTYKDPLLIDTGEYKGLTTGDDHWANYSTRTIAHNSLIMYDSEEDYFDGNRPLANDGGQQRKIAYPTYEEVLNENYLDGIQRFHRTDEYAFVLGDATKAYSKSKISNYTRSVLYINRLDSWNYPVIIVRDNVAANKPWLNKSVVYHSMEQPHIIGNNILITARNSQLLIQMHSSSPLEHTIIGGSGYEYWVEGKNRMPLPNYRNIRPEKGDWRVEVNDVSGHPTSTITSVLFVSDKGAFSYPHVEYDDAVIVENYLVIYQDEPFSTYSFSRRPLRVLLIGKPSQGYDVAIDHDNVVSVQEQYPANCYTNDQGICDMNVPP